MDEAAAHAVQALAECRGCCQAGCRGVRPYQSYADPWWLLGSCLVAAW